MLYLGGGGDDIFSQRVRMFFAHALADLSADDRKPKPLCFPLLEFRRVAKYLCRACSQREPSKKIVAHHNYQSARRCRLRRIPWTQLSSVLLRQRDREYLLPACRPAFYLPQHVHELSDLTFFISRTSDVQQIELGVCVVHHLTTCTKLRHIIRRRATDAFSRYSEVKCYEKTASIPFEPLLNLHL